MREKKSCQLLAWRKTRCAHGTHKQQKAFDFNVFLAPFPPAGVPHEGN